MSLALLVRKDLQREWRGKEALSAGLVLALLFFVLDLFAHGSLADDPAAAAVVLWTPILYGAVAVAGRGLANEADRGTLDLLRAAPVPLLWHGIARTLANGLLVGLLLALAAGAASLLFAIPVTAPLALLLALAAAGLAVVGTLTGALAAQARSRETLLPVLAVPVLAPLLQAGVAGTLEALDGASWGGLRAPLLLLASFDLLALGAAWLLWPAVLEE